jgi:hypothetical protein
MSKSARVGLGGSEAPEALVALDLDALLVAGSDPKSFVPIRLPVPELATAVYVRRLNAAELDEYSAEVKEGGDDETRALILSWAIGDKDGNRGYITDSQIAKLKAFNAKAASRIIDCFQKANGLIPEETAKK